MYDLKMGEISDSFSETSAKSVNWYLAEQARPLQYTLRDGFVVAKFARGESASGHAEGRSAYGVTRLALHHFCRGLFNVILIIIYREVEDHYQYHKRAKDPGGWGLS
jgi:hypothetical protein